jgi:hypothetical protein
MSREGLPTVRVRTLDSEGNITGEVFLGPTAAETVALNIEVALENLATLIDATGGVSQGGAARFGTENGSVEIAWDEGGRFDWPTGPQGGPQKPQS